MQVRRIILYVILIVSTGCARVNGGTEISGGVLVDKLIYSSNVVPDKGIYYMDYDGSGKTLINYLNPHEDLFGFSISPSGTTIAYGSFNRETCEAGVYLVSVDGSNKTELVGGVYLKYAPFFTPGGREMVFITGYPGESKLYSVTLERTALIEIPDEIPNIDYASFSPDGKLVVFGYESGETARIGKWDIESKRVTYISGKNVLAYTPRVSPDGKLIAYGVWEDDKLHLWVMDSEGTNPRRLTCGKYVLGAQYGFSPDSKDVVFCAEGDDGLSAVYKIGVEGTNETRLTFNQCNDIGPVYSPDGRFIAFVSSGRNTSEIFIMNSDGTGLRRLTPEGVNSAPVFSPVSVGNSILDSYGNSHALGQ